MKLKEALLCLDCDEIFYDLNVCPKCISPSFKKLTTWIKPRLEEEEEKENNGFK